MGAIGEHFQEEELRCRGSLRGVPPCPYCGGVNKCDQILVDALEELRALVGVPILVDDAYRCPGHNAQVGGVKGSQHELGIAADIKIQGMTPAEMYRAALQVPAFANGGIGVSDAPSGYIHLDCRPHRARWTYNLQGKESPWNPALDIDA